MSISFDPKVKGGGPSGAPAKGSAETTEPQQSHPGPKTDSASKPPAQDQAAQLPTPRAATTHPARPAPTGRRQLFEVEANRLRTQMRAAGPGRFRAAEQALQMCTSYAMRRSKGARRLAIDLCEEVARSVRELEELALQLREILVAEGELHESSAEATLHACQRLIRLLEENGRS